MKTATRLLRKRKKTMTMLKKKIMKRRSLKTTKRAVSLLVLQKMKMKTLKKMIRRGILKIKPAAKSPKKRRNKLPIPVS